MLTPLPVPRLNNNEDVVRISRVCVAVGDRVKNGQSIAEIATDKATFVMEADRDGYVARLCSQSGDEIGVGAVFAWIGDAAGEDVTVANDAGPATDALGPTLKAQVLLVEHRLTAAAVPRQGARLTAADVEAFVAVQRSVSGHREAPRVGVEQGPVHGLAKGQRQPLAPAERAMLRTVSWHRTEAATGYIELGYDAAAWTNYAARFQEEQRLLFNPLLSLLSWQLAQIIRRHQNANSTIVDHDKYIYEHVNLGFTVQSPLALYLVVIKEAELCTPIEFCRRLTNVIRRAMADSLEQDDLSGATVAFSSMAQWNVTRHVPILAPHTSLAIAHTRAATEPATLGATYDHRVLSGAGCVAVLEELATPSGS